MAEEGVGACSRLDELRDSFKAIRFSDHKNIRNNDLDDCPDLPHPERGGGDERHSEETRVNVISFSFDA